MSAQQRFDAYAEDMTFPANAQPGDPGAGVIDQIGRGQITIRSTA
jgi:hypothetical protein